MKHGARAGTRTPVRSALVVDVSPTSIYVFGLTVALALAAEMLAMTPPATAASEPDRRPSPVPVDAALVPELPEIPAPWQGPELPLELHAATPFGPDDKGGSYTDMGRDLTVGVGVGAGMRNPTGTGSGAVSRNDGAADAAGEPGHGALTERERALLALSRSAVESARRAGTLGDPAGRRDPETSPAIDPSVSPSEAVLQKIAERVMAQATARVPGTGDPSDHAAGTATSSPRAASANSTAVRLTPAEIAKRAAVGDAPGLVTLPAPASPVQGTPANVHPSGQGAGDSGAPGAADPGALDPERSATPTAAARKED